MVTSRRSFVAATGAGLAGLDPVQATTASSAAVPPDMQQQVAELVARSEEGNAALMRGDVQRYRELLPLASDFVLMSPFGGKPGPAKRYTDEEFAAIGRFFKNGTQTQEVVQTYATADMVVLAVLERAHVEVGGLPAQNWLLRVTLVFRREGKEWLLVHRHADPLGHGISLEQSAVLGRGQMK
jgi:ketosteroid isomerase-like protein